MAEADTRRRWMELLVHALLFVIALVVGLALLAQWIKRQSLFFPDRYPTGVWDTTGFAVAPLDQSIRSGDVTLHGWLFPSPGGKEILIWYHGNAGNITDRADTAQELARRGITVLLFDYRGFGKSQGKASESALYTDSLAAYDHVTLELRISSSNIILYGESIGGPYAAYTATKRKARCVIIENSFPSLRRLGQIIYPHLPITIFVARSMTTAKWLNEAALPVLVMHGKRDQVIPFKLGVELFEAIEKNKEMFVSESTDHSEIPAAEGERYYAAVIGFIAKHDG